jgi:hypothetical protein
MKNQYAALLLTAAFGIGASPAQADPPPWAPAHGKRAKEAHAYRYVYYPAQQVYYSPQEQVWFWMNGGNWQVGVNLPTSYRVQSGAGVSISLASRQPYVEHVHVEEQYGRPWREKHKKEKHHKHRND